MNMGRTVVLYASRYGTTERYAKEIAQRLGCEAVNVKQWKQQRFSDYDTVIFGGSLYASAIRGVKALTKHEALLDGKRLIVFTVGMAAPDSPTLEQVWAQNFSPDMQRRIAFFHLRGAIDYARLSPLHRLMMAGMHAAIGRMKEPTEELRLRQETYGTRLEWTDRAAVEPIVAAAKA